MLDNVAVRQVDVLDHQEGRGAHHRRHDLAVGRRGDFDGARLDRRIADPFHQHDGDIAASEHIGDRRARNHAIEARGQHRSLGRSAAHVAHERESHAGEIVAGTGRIEHRAEQHVEKHEAGRHAQRHSEHALGGDPEMRSGAPQRGALVRDHVGHVAAGEHVDEADDAHHHHRQTQAAPRGLEQREDAGDGDDDVESAGRALAARQRGVEQKQIAGAKGRDQRQRPVVKRHPVARASLAQRKRQIDQEHRERQVDRARHRVVEHHILLQTRIDLRHPERQG